MVDLSVILPSIRPGNLKHLYDSISDACSKHTFELIIISPYELPYNMRNKYNVKWIQDWGSPVRAQQIGLINCSGKYVSWSADDATHIKDTYDMAIDALEKSEENTVIIGKYNEGAINPEMNKIEYYRINHHNGSRCPYISDEVLMCMVCVLPTKILMDIGGFDSSKFEVLPMAFCDVSVRLYNAKLKFILQDSQMLRVTHMPGKEGDHAPIDIAQTLHDEPIFKITYNQPESVNRIKIDIQNWDKAPSKWTRRFR